MIVYKEQQQISEMTAKWTHSACLSQPTKQNLSQPTELHLS